jgi:hypothetical protein
MGQYYKAIILGEAKLSKQEIIRIFMEAWNYNNGAKLTEHSYLLNSFVSSFEYLLTPEGMFYKSRVVWAGDYADNEEGLEANLYQLTDGQTEKHHLGNIKNTKDYRYIINHTKKQYVDKQKQKVYHPLPLLTAEGNGKGGGDFRGKGEDLIGIWARDILSVEKEIPDNFTELICEFKE